MRKHFLLALLAGSMLVWSGCGSHGDDGDEEYRSASVQEATDLVKGVVSFMGLAIRTREQLDRVEEAMLSGADEEQCADGGKILYQYENLDFPVTATLEECGAKGSILTGRLRFERMEDDLEISFQSLEVERNGKEMSVVEGTNIQVLEYFTTNSQHYLLRFLCGIERNGTITGTDNMELFGGGSFNRDFSYGKGDINTEGLTWSFFDPHTGTTAPVVRDLAPQVFSFDENGSLVDNPGGMGLDFKDPFGNKVVFYFKEKNRMYLALPPAIAGKEDREVLEVDVSDALF